MTHEAMRTQAIRTEDAARHTPGQSATDDWQESWFLLWHDPITRSAGYDHISLRPRRDTVEIIHWIALEGEVIDRYLGLRDPLPAGDLSDLLISPVHIRTVAPLKTYTLGSDHAGVRSSVQFEAFADQPVAFALDRAGVELAHGHYDSHGRVSGRLVLADRIIDISALGRHDHSWGNRDHSSLRSHRFARIQFDETFYASMTILDTDFGNSRAAGFVADRGQIHRVVSCEFRTQVSDDGLTPTATDIRVWTDDLRGYRFTCSSFDCSSPSVQGGNLHSSSFGTFESGSRLGVGMFEMLERTMLSRAQRLELGLAQ